MHNHTLPNCLICTLHDIGSAKSSQYPGESSWLYFGKYNFFLRPLMNKLSWQGPVFSSDVTTRERLDRLLVRVYQRHAETNLPVSCTGEQIPNKYAQKPSLWEESKLNSPHWRHFLFLDQCHIWSPLRLHPWSPFIHVIHQYNIGEGISSTRYQTLC